MSPPPPHAPDRRPSISQPDRRETSRQKRRQAVPGGLAHIECRSGILTFETRDVRTTDLGLIGQLLLIQP